MATATSIKLNDIIFGNDENVAILGGMNVLESLDLALEVGEVFKKATERLGMPYVFKASYDKANRSSLHSYRGPGLEKGLEMFRKIKAELDVPIITDIHEPSQANAIAEVADIIQIPAFLCRQTDLLVAAAKTGKPIHVKKAQFIGPTDINNIITKLNESGNDQVMICERGTIFGYNNLIVDPLAFPVMKETGAPLTFDVTHALQQPGGLGHATAGRRQYVFPLMRAGISQGISALFVEAHPNPDEAKCDGPCALPLDKVETFLSQVKELDDLIKAQPNVKVE